MIPPDPKVLFIEKRVSRNGTFSYWLMSREYAQEQQMQITDQTFDYLRDKIEVKLSEGWD